MYIDRSELFSVRNIVLRVLVVLALVFLILWIFPIGRNNNTVNVKDNNKLVMQVFSNNLERMKIAGKDYFTTARLPMEIGESEKITLEEMIELKLITPVYDSNDKQCNTKESYISVTKLKEKEYEMKIYLECSDYSDYIIVPMGCYDFCSTAICEVPEKKDPEDVTYLYEYIKTTNGTSYWTNWTNWSTDKKTATSTLRVEDVERTNVETDKVLVRTDEEDVFSFYWFKVGTYTEKTCDGFDYVYTSTGRFKYTDWVLVGTEEYSSIPKDTPTRKYVEIEDSQGVYDCDECSVTTYSAFNVYEREMLEVKDAELTCNVVEKVVPVYTKMQKYVGTKVTPIYENVETVTNWTEYRTSSLVTTGGTSNTKYSFKNDKALLDQGYVMTGKTIKKSEM